MPHTKRQVACLERIANWYSTVGTWQAASVGFNEAVSSKLLIFFNSS